MNVWASYRSQSATRVHLPFLKATRTFYFSFEFATWLGLAGVAWGPPSRVHVFAYVAQIPPLLRPCHVLHSQPRHLYRDFTYSLNYVTQTNNLNFISLMNTNTRHRFRNSLFTSIKHDLNQVLKFWCPNAPPRIFPLKRETPTQVLVKTESKSFQSVFTQDIHT